MDNYSDDANEDVELKLPAKLVDVFLGDARYRGAYGGRGSGKTRTFAKMAAVRALDLAQVGDTGLILCAREFMNSLSDSSFAEVRAAILEEPFLADNFEIGESYIKTADGNIEFVFKGLRHNLNSIKSLARIHLAWVDEAETVSEGAWQTLTPTIREHNSELWVTWNPENEQSATNKRFRLSMPDNAKIVEMNWRDNPFFPEVLNLERLNDLKHRPDSYNHIWEGGYRTAIEGAYYATSLNEAREKGRISNVSPDPLMAIRLYCDIGGTGAKADSFVFIACQFIGKEIRVLDHYEVVGQPIASHLAWLRSRGYEPSKAQIWLPHDGVAHDKVHDVSYESAFKQAGYSVTVIPNQGKGAAMQRVEAMRRLFPSIWFNKATTENLIKALGNYREKKNSLGVGVGPLHDENSNSADAIGYMAVSYKEPVEWKPLVYPTMSIYG